MAMCNVLPFAENLSKRILFGSKCPAVRRCQRLWLLCRRRLHCLPWARPPVQDRHLAWALSFTLLIAIRPVSVRNINA